MGTCRPIFHMWPNFNTIIYLNQVPEFTVSANLRNLHLKPVTPHEVLDPGFRIECIWVPFPSVICCVILETGPLATCNCFFLSVVNSTLWSRLRLESCPISASAWGRVGGCVTSSLNTLETAPRPSRSCWGPTTLTTTWARASGTCWLRARLWHSKSAQRSVDVSHFVLFVLFCADTFGYSLRNDERHSGCLMSVGCNWVYN